MKHVLPKQVVLLPLFLFSLFISLNAQVCNWAYDASNPQIFKTPAGIVAPDGTTNLDAIAIDVFLTSATSAATDCGTDVTCAGSVAVESTIFQIGCNSPDLMYKYFDEAGAEVGRSSSAGQYLAFCPNNLPTGSNSLVGKYFFVQAVDGSEETTFRAIFINSIKDDIAPVVSIPSNRDLLLNCNNPNFASPSVTGFATATDACSFTPPQVNFIETINRMNQGSPYVPNSLSVAPNTAGATARLCERVDRLWTAIDESFNTTTSPMPQSIFVYDNVAPTFNNFTDSRGILRTASVPTIVNDAKGNFLGNKYTYDNNKQVACRKDEAAVIAEVMSDINTPIADDNCNFVIIEDQNGPTEIDRALPNQIFSSTYYNYTLRRTFFASDECGFVSTAYVDYDVRDLNSPDLVLQSAYPGTPAIQLTTSATSSKRYIVPGAIAVSGCETFLRVNEPTAVNNLAFSFTDDCALNQAIQISYNLAEVIVSNTTTTVTVGSGPIPVGGILIEGGKTYQLEINFSDPTGNTSVLTATIVASRPIPNIDCVPEPYQRTLNPSGSNEVTFFEMINEAVVQQALQNVCGNPGPQFRFEMSRDGGVNFNVSTGIFNQNPLSLAAAFTAPTEQQARVTINCEDAGRLVPVIGRIREMIPNGDGGFTPGDVIAECTRSIQVLSPSSSSLFASVSSLPATAGGSDGIIEVSGIAINPTISQNFIISVLDANTRMVVRAGVLANTQGITTITGLAAGDYIVEVSGTISCVSNEFPVTVGSSAPVFLSFDCIETIGQGDTRAIFVKTASGFNNITNLRFEIIVSGSTQVAITAANTTGQSITGANISFLDNQRILFDWSSAVPITVAPGQDLLFFQVNTSESIENSAVVIIDINGSSADYGASQRLSSGLTTPVGLGVLTPCMINVGTVTNNNNLSLGGTVSFMGTGLPVPGVNFNLMQNGVLAGTSTTTSTGAYNFSNIPSGSNVMVTPTLSGNREAISPSDFVQLNLFLTFNPSSTLTNNYQLIASDVNLDGRVNVTDAVGLRRYLVNNGTFDPDAWRFAAASQTFPTFGTTISIDPLQSSFSANTFLASNPNASFVAIKLADVDQSAISASGINDLESRSIRKVVAETATTKAASDKVLEIKAETSSNMQFFLLEFEYDTDEIDGVAFVPNEALAAAGTYDMGYSATGKLAVLWYSDTGLEIEAGDALFQLNIAANKRVNIADHIRLAEGLERRVTYDVSGEAVTLDLVFGEATTSTTAANDFRVFESAPNPFKAQTVIEFTTPSEEMITYQVFDLAGRMVKQQAAHFQAGYNQLVVNGSDLPSTGVYYVKINSSFGQFTQKLVFVY